MRAIFYDLETSQGDPIGQILNYSFILVDDRLEIVRELSGDIRISRLQIPDPEALLVNRVDPVLHQATALESEAEAAEEICSFVAGAIEEGRKSVALIGFNSSKFDLTYLRTTLVRNGRNPYFAKQIVYRDLLHAARKLAATEPAFPRPIVTIEKEGTPKERLSLRLEALCRALGLLDGEQSHHSRADVLLSIELARVMRDRFGLNPVDYHAYEPPPAEAGQLAWMLEPEYDVHAGSIAKAVPMALLNFDYRMSLWVDLERYLRGEGRKSIKAFTAAKDQFVWGGELAPFEEIAGKTVEAVAAQARTEFAAITTANFYTRTTCDIEQNFYRELDFKGIEELGKAIQSGRGDNLTNLRNRGPKILFNRYRLANAPAEVLWGGDGAESERLQKALKDYALYRYGGQAQIVFTLPEGADPATLRETPGYYHPTLRSLWERLQELKRVRTSDGDLQILCSLERFILDSDIMKVAGGELLPSITEERAALSPAASCGSAQDQPAQGQPAQDHAAKN